MFAKYGECYGAKVMRLEDNKINKNNTQGAETPAKQRQCTG